jgi:HK97 family phage portal protein
MSIMTRVKAAYRALTGLEDESWKNFMYGKKTDAGPRINEQSSLSISALFAAVNFIAGTIATLPKVVYRHQANGGKQRAIDHPLYAKLHDQPNEDMTAWQWVYTSIMHKYLWGNWYTYRNFNTYRNQRLIPLLPDRTYKDPDRPGYVFTRINNKTKEIALPKEDVLHIPHISLDGITGKGIIHYARESLGIAKAQDQFAGKFFGTGLHPGGFVNVEGKMDEETRKALQRDFNQKYAGLGKSHMVIFMTGGAKYEPEEIDPEKAQALESRQFSVVEVSRWTNLPPHILRELSRATFSNIEQQGLELVIYSLLPITTQIEQAMNATFFDEEERKTHFIKFELKGLMRGDLKTRQAFYESMLDRGVFNADMVLDLEDMNPQPDGLGKIYFVPLNMVNKKMVTGSQPLTIEASDHNRGDRGVEFSEYIEGTVEYRYTGLRRKLTQAYKKKFDAYGENIVALEVKSIREAIEKHLSERNSIDFFAWLDSFYSEFKQDIERSAAPLLSSYADALLPVAKEEIQSEADIDTEYQRFQHDYKEVFVSRHIDSSVGQIKNVVSEAQQNGEDPGEALTQRMDEWEEKRPGKITMRETIRAENAFAKAVFAAAGITKIRSVHLGKSCPYCRALDGTVIDIKGNFLTKGEFQPDNADEPLIVTGNRSHPPYHDGCDCTIAASSGG